MVKPWWSYGEAQVWISLSTTPRAPKDGPSWPTATRSWTSRSRPLWPCPVVDREISLVLLAVYIRIAHLIGWMLRSANSLMLENLRWWTPNSSFFVAQIVILAGEISILTGEVPFVPVNSPCLHRLHSERHRHRIRSMGNWPPLEVPRWFLTHQNNPKHEAGWWQKLNWQNPTLWDFVGIEAVCGCPKSTNSLGHGSPNDRR